ncbi:MAG: HAD hydrolase-like protein [Bacteriovoracaceae bacterium]|nr:HAD hydrolase-like protein [Bacteriovoracaceae bacterium]
MSYRNIIFDHDGTLVNTSGYPKHVFSYIEDILEEFKHLNLYVWTARNRQSTVDHLESFGINKYFKSIYTSSDGPSKPAGLDELVDAKFADQTIIIGDSAADMIGAKSFGGFAIGATWNSPSDEYTRFLLDAGADVVIDSTLKLKEFLKDKVKE